MRRSSRPIPATLALSLVMCACLGACSMFGTGKKKTGTPDNEPRIASILGRKVDVQADPGIAANEDKAIAAYKDFLAVAPNAPQRAEAMRRLGDLEMDSADNKGVTTASGNPDYKAAIARYQDFLKA